MMDTATRSVWTMNEITISVNYEPSEEIPVMAQISEIEEKNVPSFMKVTEINWEKNWLNGKSRVTFRGVQK